MRSHRGHDLRLGRFPAIGGAPGRAGGGDLAGLSFEQVAEQLLVRLQKAGRDRQKRDDLEQQAQRYEEECAERRGETSRV